MERAVSKPYCDPENPKHCAVDLKAGDPAPFAGQLLTPELALALGQKAEGAEGRCALEKKRERALLDIEIEKQTQLRAAEAEACKKTEERLTELLEEAQKRPFYKHPAFVSAVSAIGTAGVMVLVWWVGLQTIQATAK